MLVLGLLTIITLGVIGTVAVVVVILRDGGPTRDARSGPRSPAARGLPGGAAAPAAGAGSTGDPILPPIPAFPSPAHRLAPGVYMFGQLFRWDGRRWSAEIGDDCEPVVAIFDTPLLGTCAVTWDSVHRRASPGGAWIREYRSPNGRPRLSSGWGHPTHGLFAVGDRGTLLHSRGDGTWQKQTLPEALRTVVSAVWGDDVCLYLGTADGRIASSPWGSAGEWQIEQTPARDFVFDGAASPRGQLAITQSGEVLFRASAIDSGAPGWVIDHKLGRAVKGLITDTAGHVWVTSSEGIHRSDAPGEWMKEPLGAPDAMNAIATNGRVTWAGGGRSVLARRDARGQWTASPPGQGGTISALWVGPDQELLVGTEFMIDVAAGGKGKEAEVIASARTAG